MAGDSFTGGRLSAIAGASSGCAGADLARADLAVPGLAAGAVLPPLMARNGGGAGGAAFKPAGLPAIFNLSALPMERRPFLQSHPTRKITWFSAAKIRPHHACFIFSFSALAVLTASGKRPAAAGRVTKWCVDLDAPARKVKTPAFAAFDSQRASFH